MASRLRWAAVLAAVLGLAGCPADAPEEAIFDAGVEPNEARDVATVRAVGTGPYADAPQTLPAGEVTIVLEQEDRENLHDLRIEELDVGTAMLHEGEREAIAVELEPGTYTYYCSVPGHREAGMEGTFEVVE